MEILLQNRQRKIKVDLPKIRLAVEKILKALNLIQVELSVTLSNDKQIKELNRQYRKQNGPTDVLAFPMGEGSFKELNPFLLGDVIISLETAIKQAHTFHHSLQQELYQLLVHGILHLVGYDHGRTMRGKEQELLGSITEEQE
jgi:probable rRNA maturation factor